MKTALITASARRKQADLLIIGHFKESKLGREFSDLEPGLSELLSKAVAKGRFKGSFGEVFSSCSDSHKEGFEVLLIGLGEKKKYKEACLRKATSSLVKLIKGRKAGTVRIVLDSFAGSGFSASEAGAIIVERALFTQYDFDKYRKKEKEKSKEASLELLLLNKKQEKAAKGKLDEAVTVAEAVNWTRDLANEPANVLTPQKMVSVAKELASKRKLSIKVFQKAELKKLGMGGILGVGQGATVPPALIILEHGVRYKNKGTLCLVGKGVTFDTGGISIKPSKNMEEMKYDMCGAAAVLGTMNAVSALGLKRHVVGLVPTVENNVAEDPQRPGDIIKMHNGKTVEVLNTDAEGRLILADALTYAGRYKPKALIDLATLTGMCVYTFGDKCCGLMGNNDKLLSKIESAAKGSGERVWQLPMWDDYGQQIKGHHSDLYNIGGTYGGTITAAKFLEEFIPEDTAWAHLDIAGTAWASAAKPECQKGATGYGVRLLTNLISNWK